MQGRGIINTGKREIQKSRQSDYNILVQNKSSNQCLPWACEKNNIQYSSIGYKKNIKHTHT